MEKSELEDIAQLKIQDLKRAAESADPKDYEADEPMADFLVEAASKSGKYQVLRNRNTTKLVFNNLVTTREIATHIAPILIQRGFTWAQITLFCLRHKNPYRLRSLYVCYYRHVGPDNPSHSTHPSKTLQRSPCS